MALILNLYKDGICKQTGLECGLGVAGITGTLANKSNWIAMQQYGILFKPNVGTSYAGVVLSGATPIFNLASIPDLEKLSDPANAIISDKTSNASSTYVYNAFFCGIDSESGNILKSNVIEFFASNSGSYPSGGIRFRQYTQTPVDANMQSRQTWNYNALSGYEFGAQMQGALERCICVYKINIWETDYYLFAIGVSAGGDLNHNLKLVLIPVSHFKDREIKPYVGPVSKDSAAASFAPTRDKYRDTLKGYDLTNINKDPFGLCTGNGNTKLFKLTQQNYLDLIDGIYSGTSSSVIGTLGQGVVNFFNQSGGRSYEDIQAMIGSVQTIHMIPQLNVTASSNVTITSLGGYALGNSISVQKLDQQITTRGQSGPITFQILPRGNSFLNYSPYTQATLVLPWVGNINIDPSELYGYDINTGNVVGATLKIEYAFDCLTGLLTLYTTSQIPGLTAEHLINVSQVNVAVEVPIFGLGTASEKSGIKAISGAISAIASVFTGNVSGVVNGISTISDASIDMSKIHSVSNQGIGSIAPYFSPTEIGLILSYPKALNAGSFAEEIGLKCNMSGTVGSFSGYSEIINVNLSSVNATQAVKEQIISRLKEGVIL